MSCRRRSAVHNTPSPAGTHIAVRPTSAVTVTVAHAGRITNHRQCWSRIKEQAGCSGHNIASNGSAAKVFHYKVGVDDCRVTGSVVRFRHNSRSCKSPSRHRRHSSLNSPCSHQLSRLVATRRFNNGLVLVTNTSHVTMSLGQQGPGSSFFQRCEGQCISSSTWSGSRFLSCQPQYNISSPPA